MKTSSLILLNIYICSSLLFTPNGLADAQIRRPPRGGPVAIIVDERLAALRQTPDLSGILIQRLSRGRFVAIRRTVRRQGLTFYYVRATRRRSGWLQSEAVISLTRAGEDKRLHRLLLASGDFDLIVRSRIFLNAFPRSSLRPAVLALLASAAEAAAEKLSREAKRRLNEKEMMANGALEFSFYLNYSGLDRYNRQGIKFVFNEQTKSLEYDGSAWREIMRRYPNTAEAEEAHRKSTPRVSCN